MAAPFLYTLIFMMRCFENVLQGSRIARLLLSAVFDPQHQRSDPSTRLPCRRLSVPSITSTIIIILIGAITSQPRRCELLQKDSPPLHRAHSQWCDYRGTLRSQRLNEHALLRFIQHFNVHLFLLRIFV